MDFLTPVGLAALIIAVITGVLQWRASRQREMEDKPATKLLRERINDLVEARADDKEAILAAKVEADAAKVEAAKARQDAAMAREIATGRAKVDELFEYAKTEVVKSVERQERTIAEVKNIAAALMEAVETGHALRNETMRAIVERHEIEMKVHQEHARISLERHDQQMAVMRQTAELLTKMAAAFDVKINGGQR
jgi:hypothetical protein